MYAVLICISSVQHIIISKNINYFEYFKDLYLLFLLINYQKQLAKNVMVKYFFQSKLKGFITIINIINIHFKPS